MIDRTKLVGARRFSKQVVGKFFGPGSNGVEAVRLKREDPQLYQEIRAQAVEDGIVGPAPQSPSPLARMVLDQQARDNAEANKSYTSEEVKARAMYSEQACRELFERSGQEGNTHNAGALKRDNPELYRLAKISAISHGVLPPQPFPAPIAQPKAPEPDGKITISDSLAADLHLPAGTKVEAERLSEFIQIASEVKQAREHNQEQN